MLIQVMSRNGWSDPQEVLDHVAVQLLNNGGARPAVPLRETASKDVSLFERAAKFLRLK